MSRRAYDGRRQALSIDAQQGRLIKRIISKFGKTDIRALWEFHSDFCRLLPDFNFSRSRAKMVSDLYNIVVNHSLKTTSFEMLMTKFSLLYVSLHSETVSWRTYLLTSPDQRQNISIDLESALKRELSNSNINCCIASHLRMECMWLCLYFNPQNSSQPKNLYITLHPLLPYVLAGGNVKVNIWNVVFKILSKVCQSRIEYMSLQGHHVEGLLKMAYQKNHQRISDNEHLPMILRRSHRRLPALDEPVPEIKNADLTHIQERKPYVEKIFGKYEPPRMDKLSILTCTDFCGLPENPNNGKKARCAIIFQGSHVMLGMSKFMEQGIINRKLPSVLEDLTALGTDTIYIND